MRKLAVVRNSRPAAASARSKRVVPTLRVRPFSLRIRPTVEGEIVMPNVA
jgi:hypothetical protein